MPASQLQNPDPAIVTDLPRLLRSRHWAQHLKLFSRAAARNMLLGNTRSRFRGRGMEFEEVRRYQPGDDIRNIDWKVSARAGGTYTKLFCEERERPCHIMVDQRSHLYFGSGLQFKSVLAAELASAIGWAALSGGDRVGGQVLGNYAERDSRARRNKQSVLRLIHDIHELNQLLAIHRPNAPTSRGPATSLANSLEECRRITRPGTAIFIISGFHDFNQPAAKALSNLSKHTDITLLQVVDPLEQELPVVGSVSISDGDQSAKVQLSDSLRQAYLEKLSRHQASLKSAAVRARALYTEISTQQTARQALATIFGR
ncbi:MAG: DUF58 domain-containing protein [Gammaproteobacteria bacterium]|nr:DUF58 domain-containing protein [Gammaproteobacteria bacterium]